MSDLPKHTDHPVFTVSAGALLAVGGYATGQDDHVDLEAVEAEIGMFVGGSTFVGHGVIVEGTARLTLRSGLAGYVTMFVCVAGEVRGAFETLVGDDGSLVVSGRHGFVDALDYLRPFGATSTEIEDVEVLDAEVAQRWMTSLGLRGFVEHPARRARRESEEHRARGTAAVSSLVGQMAASD